MKRMFVIGSLFIMIIAGFIAGCADEVLDPELDFEVIDVLTNASSPNPNGVLAGEGKHFVWVKVRLENQNKNNDITITPGDFRADDNTTEVKAKYMANHTYRRRIDNIRVDPQTTKDFWVIFLVNDGSKLLYIRFHGTLDEPVEKQMPSYPPWV